MNWFITFLRSSVGKKLIMSLTGLFLCTFLVIHMLGNMQLLKSDGGVAFNHYSHFMAHNGLIQLISKVNFLLILFHLVDGLFLAYKNKQARPEQYAVAPKSSTWASRNMAILGTLILVFLIIHLKTFWFAAKFGQVPSINIEGQEMHDLYSVVVAAFSQWWYVGIYLVGLLALAYHLLHGFQSAFQTLGINHPKYTPAIKALGTAFAIGIPLAFATQPIFLFLKHVGIL
jgi:succinate dehydrogenase / fumarate reductase cytochrome b subunit